MRIFQPSFSQPSLSPVVRSQQLSQCPSGWAHCCRKGGSGLVAALGLMLWVVAPAQMVDAQPVSINSAATSVQLRGTSGGSQRDRSCAEHIAPSPNHTLELNEDTNLRFVLQAEGGEPALLIRSAQGKDFCVPADSYSKGQIAVPGRLSRGSYSIYVGDRANGQHAYQLSISRR